MSPENNTHILEVSQIGKGGLKKLFHRTKIYRKIKDGPKEFKGFIDMPSEDYPKFLADFQNNLIGFHLEYHRK